METPPGAEAISVEKKRSSRFNPLFEIMHLRRQIFTSILILLFITPLFFCSPGNKDKNQPEPQNLQKSSSPSPSSPRTEPARIGDTVLVYYTAKLPTGETVDSTSPRKPLRLTIGKEEYIIGLERALIGMKPGEKKTVTIPPEQAYGLYQPQLVRKVNRRQIFPPRDLEVGKKFTFREPDGSTLPVKVIALDENTVTFDANHPLAGKTIIMEITLVSIASE